MLRLAGHSAGSGRTAGHSAVSQLVKGGAAEVGALQSLSPDQYWAVWPTVLHCWCGAQRQQRSGSTHRTGWDVSVDSRIDSGRGAIRQRWGLSRPLQRR
jgi:hypothetical protein